MVACPRLGQRQSARQRTPCSVEILAGRGEEHEVVGQDPEAALPLAGVIGPAAQRAPEPPLVPAERGLGLPPLAVHPAVPAALGLLPEPLGHLPPGPGLGPLPAPGAAGSAG